MSAEKDSKVLFDAAQFEHDIKAARDATKPSQAEEDKHLAKLENWTTFLGVGGLLLAMQGAISPTSMVMVGFYWYAKFAIIAHHSLHGGWGVKRRGWFGQGVYRRIVDWLDWIFPTAWIVEHNKTHHYYLNEDLDPDFVERNTEEIRVLGLPKWVLYAVVAVDALLWKWGYYASNTLKLLHADKPGAPSKENFKDAITMIQLIFRLHDPWHRALAFDLVKILAPKLLINFVAIPMLAGVLHQTSYGMLPWCWFTLINIVGAEAFTNMHAFATIVTNHAGGDMWHFTGSCKADSAEFILRATLGSTAYPAGNDFIDYFHGYLNYQCEHHAFPALSPLHYQRLHPHFFRICAEHGVPTVKENIIVRTMKTAEVMVGNAKHKRIIGQACDQPELWNLKAKAA
jgi:fatty acid desaturase